VLRRSREQLQRDALRSKRSGWRWTCGLLAQADLGLGSMVLAVAGHSDGRVVLRRLLDAEQDLLAVRSPI